MTKLTGLFQTTCVAIFRAFGRVVSRLSKQVCKHTLDALPFALTAFSFFAE